MGSSTYRLARRLRTVACTSTASAARLALCALVAALACAPKVADAHVKWFVQFDLLCPPREPFSVMMSRYFLGFAAVVLPLMFAVAYVDQRTTGHGLLARVGLKRIALGLEPAFAFVARHAPAIIRYAAALFFFILFVTGSFILTPELKTQTEWVRWLQLAVALLLLTQRSAWLGALGVAVLYGKAVADYGLFHMLDYPIFPGVAIYILMWSLWDKRTDVLADAVLRGFTSITLLWAGIEKFAYPEWSFPLLAEKPALTFGFNPEFYMVAAGFVEFCAAYLLISGRLASRAAAFVLLLLFVSAIVPFGAIDALGHSVIIVVLVVLSAGSNNPAAPHLEWRSPGDTAFAHTCVFLAVLILLIGAYYGGHFLSFNR